MVQVIYEELWKVLANRNSEIKQGPNQRFAMQPSTSTLLSAILSADTEARLLEAIRNIEEDLTREIELAQNAGSQRNFVAFKQELVHITTKKKDVDPRLWTSD